MRRRDFIRGMGAGSLTLGAAATSVGASLGKPQFNWTMVTTWPTNFPGLGTGANRLAESIVAMSGGRIAIRVHGAGDLVPTYGVFEAVSKGAADMGHGSAIYWKDRSPAIPFFSSIPFGMSASQANGWLYHGGGLDLWTEVYDPFGLIPMPVGNTGVQMGGWFNKEIRTVADLDGLKMRIPGLGAEVLARAGGRPVDLPGEALLGALQDGSLDAAEWVGPYNDLAFGLYKAAKYYYYPSWQEPATVMEAIINRRSYEALSPDLQAIVVHACKAANQDMLAEYSARNPVALQTLVSRFGVEVRRFPDAVIDRLRALSAKVLEERVAKDELAARVHASYRKFQIQSLEWAAIDDATRSMRNGLL
ncbi:TRAP transporter substrate-binding protein [Thiorhodococcus fuscus]|uniref:TRAP transporter substrate-binding protein n=1 Tax=Thiorhodococcus fuscus TaxID=527200 RepID=A0ABW4YBN0_9GAMM